MALALPVAALVMTAVGTAVAYSGAQQQKAAAKQMGDYNAEVARVNAQQAQQEADFNAEMVRERNRKLVSSQRNSYSASGITLDDTAADVMNDTVISGELDALSEQYKGKVAFTRGMQQSELARLEGSNLAASYGRQGTQTLLTGASSMIGQANSTFNTPRSNPQMAY